MRPLEDLDDLADRPFPANTPAARCELANLPAAYTFESFPGDPAAARAVRQWSQTRTPAGLLLQGASGLGKTGLVVSALTAAAEQGIGRLAWWNLMTLPTYRAAAAAGSLRRRPAPVWFESWPALRDRLRATWRRRDPRDEEADSLGEADVLAELEARVTMLGLDDLDIDAMTDWKEAVVLRLLGFPGHGRALLMTINTPVARFLDRFGERCADRLLDPALFQLCRLSAQTGPSLRRRLA